MRWWYSWSTVHMVPLRRLQNKVSPKFSFADTLKTSSRPSTFCMSETLYIEISKVCLLVCFMVCYVAAVLLIRTWLAGPNSWAQDQGLKLQSQEFDFKAKDSFPRAKRLISNLNLLIEERDPQIQEFDLEAKDSNLKSMDLILWPWTWASHPCGQRLKP